MSKEQDKGDVKFLQLSVNNTCLRDVMPRTL
jgi:hypothetical protein